MRLCKHGKSPLLLKWQHGYSKLCNQPCDVSHFLLLNGYKGFPHCSEHLVTSSAHTGSSRQPVTLQTRFNATKTVSSLTNPCKLSQLREFIFRRGSSQHTHILWIATWRLMQYSYRFCFLPAVKFSFRRLSGFRIFILLDKTKVISFCRKMTMEALGRCQYQFDFLTLTSITILYL